ncbi:MAG: hypothetical protein ABIN89_19425 [Chitinophagaceae bacterium]
MIYETLLSSPGMNDAVRIDVKLPRKNVLLLAKVIELGLSVKDQTPKGDLLHSINMECVEELRSITGEFLSKSVLQTCIIN